MMMHGFANIKLNLHSGVTAVLGTGVLFTACKSLDSR